jgi:hypothetical protein
MGIPISVWGFIPNRVAPHSGLVVIPIWGATYTHNTSDIYQVKDARTGFMEVREYGVNRHIYLGRQKNPKIHVFPVRS